MSDSKRNTIAATIKQGLAAANRGSIYWSKADAMQTFSLFHSNARKGA